jgi:hypothetical protein
MVAVEIDEPTRIGVSVFGLGGKTEADETQGARQVACVAVDRSELRPLTSTLESRGLALGAYTGDADFIWRNHAGLFTVWSSDETVLQADKHTLTLPSGPVTVTPALKVVAFVDADYVRRGVALRQAEGGGADAVVACHWEHSVGLAWVSYGALDALADSGWTVYLGRALADFLGVELIDETDP